ncbi:MAG: T9SS type A sorting domain-containing protein [Ginsengibacter sp.]
MIHKFLLFGFLISFSAFSFAQKTSKAYAITGQSNGNFNWSDIREIDLSTGKVAKTIFESGKTKFSFETSLAKQKINSGDNNSLPTQSMVAAAAYDRKHDKLFFTPMKIGELRWLDLSSKPGDQKFYAVQDQLIKTGDLNDEANQITRMVIGADGNGYAISNDANHLISFSTGKKIVITDLGNLVDAQSNNGISIHNKCSSWGGDLVADAYGKLYLFSAPQNVFVIDVQSREAKYLGHIKNLTPTFTVNGAAVVDEDNVAISSANTFEGFYTLNMKDMNAVKINTAGQVYNASDLANGNLLYQDKVRNEVGTAQLVQKETIGNNIISIYPNPVTGNQFKVTFDNARSGKYDIALTDVQGRLITTRRVNINLAKQSETVQMKLKPAGGLYMVKVTNANKKSFFVDKIIID